MSERPGYDAMLRIAVLAFAAVALVLSATGQSLWVDEVSTVSMSRLSAIGQVYDDAQLPLTYLLVAASRALFGENELAYRLPSIGFALTTLVLVARMARRSGIDPVASELAPLLLLLHPTFLHYAVEARAYMPMLATLLLFGLERERRGVLGFLVCTLALQSNTFAVIYVATVVVIDALARPRGPAAPAPSRAPWLALAVHVPSIAYVLHRTSSTRLPALTHGHGASLAARVLSPRFVDYLDHAYVELLAPRPMVFLAFLLAGLLALTERHEPMRRFFVGVALALVLHAQVVAVSGWPTYDRYLLMMLPLATVPVMLAVRGSRARSVALVVALVLVGHASIPTASGGSPIALLFPATARELGAPSREDWRALTPRLGALVRPGQHVGFVCHGQCNHYPLLFYGARNPTFGTLRYSEGCEGDYVVADARRLPAEPACRRPLVADFGTLFLFGPGRAGEGDGAAPSATPSEP